jgi:hypothetical protein
MHITILLESSEEVSMSGIIKAFEHSNKYTKSKYADDDIYDEAGGDDDDEQKENIVQLPRMQLVTIVLLILPTNFLFFYCFKMD